VTDAFQDRERGFERKFALEQEQKFKIKAHRDRLFGLWVAEQLGKTGSAAEAYASELVAADFEDGNDEGLLRKVRTDLQSRRISLDDSVLRTQLRQAESDSSRDILDSPA
jgi:hypothetical protein